VRLAVARIRTGAPRILIFDEAASTLDYESEKIIQKNMDLICQDRTVSIISRRLSALKPAHRIFLIEKGRLAESSTPEELLRLKGAYYSMVLAQNSQRKGSREIILRSWNKKVNRWHQGLADLAGCGWKWSNYLTGLQLR
jgi:subfamily B ATP-binding cassette protein HlyB/CyaB